MVIALNILNKYFEYFNAFPDLFLIQNQIRLKYIQSDWQNGIQAMNYSKDGTMNDEEKRAAVKRLRYAQIPAVIQRRILVIHFKAHGNYYISEKYMVSSLRYQILCRVELTAFSQK